MNEIQWLISTSQALGRNSDLVQGTGGNISVKLDGKMIIKPSGVKLEDASRGYTTVSLEKILGIYRNELSEDDALKAVFESVIEGGKPSIETGFHSFLGKYVVHFHPASMNIILCSEGGENVISELFADTKYLWMPYIKVGHKLASKIRSAWNGEEIIFLENHGIIVQSNDRNRCTKNLEEARKRILNHLSSIIPGFSAFGYKYEGGFRSGKIRGFLFPDAAVFSVSNKIKITGDGIQYDEEMRNVDEVLAANMYIDEMIGKIGRHKYLTEEEITDLLGMEMEKYRRKLVGL